MEKHEIVIPVGPVVGHICGITGASFLALAFTSASMSYRPGGWPWEPVFRLSLLIPRFPTAAWLSLIGLALLVTGWWLIRPKTGSLPLRWAGLWLLPMLFGPPLMSGDAFAYADAGWLYGQGLNPYDTGLCAKPGPFSESVDRLWCKRGVNYPALAIWVSWVGTVFTGGHPYFGMIVQRFIAIVGWGLAAWGLARIADRVSISRTWAWWFGLFNPVVLMHGIGGAHNDLLMAGLMLAALGVAASIRVTGIGKSPVVGDALDLEFWGRLIGSSVLVGVAMGVKPQAGLALWAVGGLLVPALDNRSRLNAWLEIIWRAFVATIVAVSVFVLISIISGLGFGWIKAIWLSGSVITMSPYFLSNDVLLHLQTMLMVPQTPYSNSLATFIMTGCALTFIWLSFRWSREPLRVLAWGSVLVVVANKGLLMWYLILPAVVFAVVELRPKRVRQLTSITVGYLFAYLWYFLYAWPIWVDVIAGLIVGTITFGLTGRSRGLRQWQRAETHLRSVATMGTAADKETILSPTPLVDAEATVAAAVGDEASRAIKPAEITDD